MRKLAWFLLIILINISCSKSQDENLKPLSEIQRQHTDRLKHLPSINPIEGGKIINRFGTEVASLINNGIDIAVEKEADVFAAADGIVTEIKKGMTTGENLVMIDHGYGFQTKYTNLTEILVEANQSVKRWTVIGRIKKSGDQPGFLYYEVIKNGENVDPERFIF